MRVRTQETRRQAERGGRGGGERMSRFAGRRVRKEFRLQDLRCNFLDDVARHSSCGLLRGAVLIENYAFQLPKHEEEPRGLFRHPRRSRSKLNLNPSWNVIYISSDAIFVG